MKKISNRVIFGENPRPCPAPFLSRRLRHPFLAPRLAPALMPPFTHAFPLWGDRVTLSSRLALPPRSCRHLSALFLFGETASPFPRAPPCPLAPMPPPVRAFPLGETASPFPRVPPCPHAHAATCPRFSSLGRPRHIFLAPCLAPAPMPPPVPRLSSWGDRVTFSSRPALPPRPKRPPHSKFPRTLLSLISHRHSLYPTSPIPL